MMMMMMHVAVTGKDDTDGTLLNLSHTHTQTVARITNPGDNLG